MVLKFLRMFLRSNNRTKQDKHTQKNYVTAKDGSETEKKGKQEKKNTLNYSEKGKFKQKKNISWMFMYVHSVSINKKKKVLKTRKDSRITDKNEIKVENYIFFVCFETI